MSKKNLLKENTIRRFMKLAEIAPLTDAFVKDSYTASEELEEMAPAYLDDDADAPEDEEELAVDDAEMGADELGAEMDTGAEDLAPPAPEMEEGEVELTMSPEQAEALVTLLKSVESAVDGAPEPVDVDAPDMGSDEEDAAAMDAELSDDEDVLGAEGDEIDVVDDEDLVNEVAARVAKRLLTKNRR